MLLFYAGRVLVSGPEDGATEWSWGGELLLVGLCVTWNLLQPKVADSSSHSGCGWSADTEASGTLPRSWIQNGADGGSLSAFPWMRVLTTLCCSAAVELTQLQLGTAVPVRLPGQCFCPLFATSVWLRIRGYLGCNLKFLSNFADYRRGEGEPRTSNWVSISAAATSGLPEALADISACKLTPLWPFTILNMLYLYPILSFLLTPLFLCLCFACRSKLSLGVSNSEDKRGV